MIVVICSKSGNDLCGKHYEGVVVLLVLLIWFVVFIDVKNKWFPVEWRRFTNSSLCCIGFSCYCGKLFFSTSCNFSFLPLHGKTASCVGSLVLAEGGKPERVHEGRLSCQAYTVDILLRYYIHIYGRW